MDVLRRAWLPVCCALLQSLAVGTGVDTRAEGPGAAFTVLGVASGLALFGRNRAPFTVLAVTAVGYAAQVLVGGPAIPAAVGVMLYAVGRRTAPVAGRRSHPLPWTAAALLGGAASVVGVLTVAGDSDEAGPYGLFVVLCGVAGLLRALHVAREEQRRRDLVAAERLRIARDLHDVVGHGLGAITVQAGAARMALAAGAPADATRSLAAIENAGRSVLREVRWLVGLLREEGEHPAMADVGDLVGNARRSGLDVALRLDGDLDRVPEGAGEAAYRIVQEALTNVLRHGGGSGADVVVRVDESLDLRIVDRGMQDASLEEFSEGNGVRGMRERATAAGGTLHAGPEPDGRGWAVRASLPLARRP
jgi:signal transduction histidine kinase